MDLGGEGEVKRSSGISLVRGVFWKRGCCHSKCGVDSPWKMAESRDTIRPRGKENLA